MAPARRRGARWARRRSSVNRWHRRSTPRSPASPGASPSWVRASARRSSGCRGGASGCSTGRWRDPSFKTQLFRFVDVFPALDDDADVAPPPRRVLRGHRGAEGCSTSGSTWPTTCRSGRPVEAASVARRNIAAHGRAVHRRHRRPPRRSTGLHQLWRQGQRGHRRPARREDRSSRPRPTATRPGSTSCSTRSADATGTWAPDDHLERDDLGPIPAGQREHQADRARRRTTSRSTREDGHATRRKRAAPAAAAAGARTAARSCTSTWSTTTSRTSRCSCSATCSSEPEFADLDAGIVVQAYLKDSRDDLADLIAWSARRTRPITVRLVKGAYWDTETVQRRGRGLAGARVRATRPRPTPTTSAACACCTTTTARCGPRSGATTCARSPTRSPTPRAEGHPRHRLRDPDALRDGRADARRDPPAGPAAAGVRAGRRARAGHGVPRAPAAREHVATRASCATASPRAATSTSCSRRLRSSTLPEPDAAARRAGHRPDGARRRTSPSRWPSGAGRRRAPTFEAARSSAVAAAGRSTCPR